MKMTQSPVVIVSGASRGVGAATARWLASTGAAVTLISRSEGALDDIVKEVQRLRGELEAPEVPGRSLAWLALHGPREFSGQFLDYDDPRISGPALDFFGEKLK